MELWGSLGGTGGLVEPGGICAVTGLRVGVSELPIWLWRSWAGGEVPRVFMKVNRERWGL